MNKPSKKRPEQHRTDTDGLQLFENALPNTDQSSFVFTRGQNDYGIDGEVQVTLGGVHTGEFFKVQVKSTKSPNYIDNGKQLSLSLDVVSAYFLVQEVTSPTALIVVDTKSRKVFWHPIQTDQATRFTLEKSLSQESVTIRIDTANVLSPDNYQPFYEYLQEADSRLSQKKLLQTKTNPTLYTGMKFLSEIERKIINVDGFTPQFRMADDPISEGTVFSIGYDGQKMIDYVPSSTYRPELTPKLNIKASFSTKTKEGRAKADAFKKLIEKGKGTVKLSSDNIDDFKVASGDTIIGDESYVENGTSLQLSSSINKTRQRFFISNGTDEMENVVETWLNDGKIYIESLPKQPLYIFTSFTPQESPTATFNVRINGDKLKSAMQEKRLMEFFRNTKEIELSFVDPEGFRRKMFAGEMNGEKVASNEAYQFIKALTEIEEVSGVPIPYPLPAELKKADIDNVFWVHKLLTQGKVTQDITFNIELKKGAEQPGDMKKGGVILMTQSPPEIYLFGKPYVIEGFKQEVRGVITSLEKKSQNKYKIRVGKAEISLAKETS